MVVDPSTWFSSNEKLTEIQRANKCNCTVHENGKEMTTTKIFCNCVESCECLTPLKKCNPDVPSITIRKLCELLEDVMASKLYDRHMSLIREYFAATDYAIMMQDIPQITRILELMMERLNSVPRYRKVLIQLLELCKIRPMLKKTSECLTCGIHFTQYFNMFGYLLSLAENDNELQLLVLEIIASIFNRKTEMKISCVKLETCYECLKSSQLPETIVELLLISSETIYPLLLKITRQIADATDALCAKLAKAGALDYILLRMEPNWKSRNSRIPPVIAYPDSNVILHFEETCKVFLHLLNGLSNIDKKKRMQIKPASIEALRSLQYVCRITVKYKVKRYDRNLITILIIKYYALFPNLLLIQSGLAEDFIQLSVATEILTNESWVKNIAFEIDEHDYYYKKMLLLMLCMIITSKDPYMKCSVQNLMKTNMVIPGLMQLITPGIGSNWHPQLFRRLTNLGLHTLHLIIPHFPEDFVGNNGIVRLVTMIQMFTANEFEIGLFRGILTLLYFSMTLKNDRIKREMQELKVYITLIDVCKYMLEKNTLTHAYQKCLGLCFSSLEILWPEMLFPGGIAIELCLKCLQRILNPTTTDTAMDNVSVTCFVTFLWEVLNFDIQLLTFFNQEGGIYKILDLIQTFDFPVKLVGLGLLADLVEEESSVPFIITWRNKRQNILNLLIEIFRQENERICTRHTSRGLIEDTEYPLMGEQQILKSQSQDKDFDVSPAYADMLGSCRPKIYAILEVLNYRHSETVALTNEHYRLYDYSLLSADEKVSLLLIQNYLALKLGEVWEELDQALQKVGLRPIVSDFEIIQNLKRRHRYWAQNIQAKQKDELQEEININTNEERKFYHTLKNARLSSSLEALHELEYIARTTDRQFLLLRKKKQRKDVSNLLHFPISPQNAEVSKHRTYMHRINVTPVFKQKLSIDSNSKSKKDQKPLKRSKMF